MNHRTCFTVFFIFLLLLPFIGHCQGEVTVVFTFTNIRKPEGKVCVGIFNDEGQWTDHPMLEPAFSKSRLSSGTLVAETILGTPGEYAFAILDDINGNIDMDYNLLGIPKEGFGLSNNPRAGLFHKPTFEECKVTLKPGRNFITIHMKYL
jgi:uncharacterized protein (DUF2141 family)